MNIATILVLILLLGVLIWFFLWTSRRAREEAEKNPIDPCPECDSGRLVRIHYEAEEQKPRYGKVEYLHRFEWQCDNCGHTEKEQYVGPRIEEPWGDNLRTFE